MKSAYERVCILGLGESGKSAYKLLTEDGIEAWGYDDCKNCCDIPMIEDVHDITKFDLVVVSPGFDFSHEIITIAREHDVEIISELELGYRYSLCDLIAISGTNGKTSTTKMVDTMLRYSGLSVRTGGNIGVPFTSFCKDMTITDVGILEVSSFQLEHTQNFHPHVAIMLNITPDHIDRHGSFDNYVLAKSKLFQNMQDADYVIANYDDENVRNCLSSSRANIFWLSLNTKQKTGVFRDKDRYIYAEYGRFRPIANCIETIKITNEYNVMAIYALAGILNIPFYTALRAIKHLDTGRYNMNVCGELEGVRFYNDSKATNTSSVLNDIGYLGENCALILGGRSKGENYTSFIEKLVDHTLFLVGENSQELQDIALACDIPSQRYDSLKSATESAYIYCREKGVKNVLFAPASASFDSYLNYVDRGDDFDKIVEDICSRNSR